MLVYVSLAVTALLIASPVVKLAGPKRALFSSSLFYTFFILAHLGEFAALLVGSVTIGVAAGIFWTAQGTYLGETRSLARALTSCLAATCSGGDGAVMGRLTAIFLSVFNLSFVVGPASSAVLLGIGCSIEFLLLGLGGISLLGVAGFGMSPLPSADSPDSEDDTTFSPVPSTPQSPSLSETSNDMQLVEDSYSSPPADPQRIGTDGKEGVLQLLTSPILLLLLPLMLYNGTVFGVVAGQLPLLLDDLGFKPLVTVAHGAGRVCSCVLFGWFEGRLPRRVFVVAATGCSLIAIFCVGCVLSGNRSTPLILSAAAFFGLSIGCTDATLLAVLGTLFYHNSEAVFATNECVGTLAMAGGFACTSLVRRLDLQMAAMSLWTLTALSCFILLDCFVCAVDPKPSIKNIVEIEQNDFSEVELTCHGIVEKQCTSII